MPEIIDKIALLHIHDGRILSTRSRGRSAFYFPGGKREPGESDRETLDREIHEELSTSVERARPWATYQARADSHPDGVEVRMTCWTAIPTHDPTASAEIDQVVWLDGDEDDQVSLVDRLILAALRAKNLLRPGEGATGRAILFDLDDTLLMTREVKWAHHRQVARDHYGIELDDQTLAEHWGKPFDEMIGLYYRHSAPVEQMRAANAASASHYPKTAARGAVNTVNALLDAGIVVGVVTSTNTEAAGTDLARCGFPVDRFALVQGADRTTAHKPDPGVFSPALDTLTALGVQHVTYVGDALIDATAATAANLDFIAVTTGLFDHDAFHGHPTLNNLAELCSTLL